MKGGRGSAECLTCERHWLLLVNNNLKVCRSRGHPVTQLCSLELSGFTSKLVKVRNCIFSNSNKGPLFQPS